MSDVTDNISVTIDCNIILIVLMQLITIDSQYVDINTLQDRNIIENNII